MRLEHLKKTWSQLNRGERISIIEASQERRLKAFNGRKKRATKSKKKKKRKSKKRKSYTKPKSPEQLMKMKKKMSKEEWENFKLMVGMS